MAPLASRLEEWKKTEYTIVKEHERGGGHIFHKSMSVLHNFVAILHKTLPTQHTLHSWQVCGAVHSPTTKNLC